MPELPEVETMVRGIRSTIVGSTIHRMEFCRCTRKPITISPAPKELRKQVENHLIHAVRRLGKRIIIDLGEIPRQRISVMAGEISNRGRVPDGSTQNHLVIEPRMTGLLLISNPPTEEHRRICWQLSSATTDPCTLQFWDRRGLGTVRGLSSSQLEELTASLGTDALQMNADLWKQKLSRTRRSIKTVLLDQKIVAGIGNLYASEILHHAGIDPRKQANQIATRQRQRLQLATMEVLTAAIHYEGSTLNDGTYRNALNQSGSYQNHHQVYNRESKPCSRCGHGQVRRIVQAQRSTFFCPRCQR